MPIVSDAGSGLSIPNAGPWNWQRFADVRDAWLSIPAVRPAGHHRLVGPRGRRAARIADAPPGQQQHLPAECQAFGHSIYFNADDADLMPDYILRNLIGHDLAPVRQDARAGSCANPPGAAHQQRENQAVSVRWVGRFSIDDLRDWANAYSAGIMAATGNQVSASSSRDGEMDDGAQGVYRLLGGGEASCGGYPG